MNNNTSIQTLTIDSKSIEDKTNIVFYSNLIFLLHYVLIIPPLVICFSIIIKYCRKQNLITSEMENDLLESCNEIKITKKTFV